MNKPKVLFLDWYITLSHSHYWEHLRKDNPEAYEIFSEWLLEHMDEFREWMRGRLSTREICELIAESCDHEADFIQKELEKSCEVLQIELPEIIHEIHRLRTSGVTVVLATDNIPEFSTVTVVHQNLSNVFDDILNSADLGALKSDAGNGFFREYLRDQNVTTSDCLLFDDSLAVSEGIEGTGLEQWLVKDPAETLSLLRSL